MHVQPKDIATLNLFECAQSGMMSLAKHSQSNGGCLADGIEPKLRETGNSSHPTYCPAMCLLEPGRNPRRRSITFTTSVLLHVAILGLSLVHLHSMIELEAIPPTIALNAISIAAPAAPSSPIEEKIAQQITKKQDGTRRQPEEKRLFREPSKLGITEDADASASPLPQISSTFPSPIASSPIASSPITSLLQLPSGHPITQKGSNNIRREVSEAAAPRSEAAPVGILSGGRATWEGSVLAKLAAYRRYPQVSRLRYEQGVVYIRFRLNREGRVLSSSIERSSGFAALDKEAVATLFRAQPLPPIPGDRPDELELSLPVEFLIR